MKSATGKLAEIFETSKINTFPKPSSWLRVHQLQLSEKDQGRAQPGEGDRRMVPEAGKSTESHSRDNAVERFVLFVTVMGIETFGGQAGRGRTG